MLSSLMAFKLSNYENKKARITGFSKCNGKIIDFSPIFYDLELSII